MATLELRAHVRCCSALLEATGYAITHSSLSFIVTKSCHISKKYRKMSYEELDKVVWEWFVRARAKNIQVSDRLIQEEA